MVLQIKDLTKSYFPGGNEVRVLKGISFSVERGDFLSIMGPSGSGKSTLMHILGGLDRPTTGSYYLDGEELGQMDDMSLSAIRNSRIGFVFQAFHLIPHATVMENVLMPALYGRADIIESSIRAERLLESVGLQDRVNFYPPQLSGGQKQRVAIARALLNQPAIILADEPTGNLDTKTGEDIMALLQYLNSLGKTILMVTHEKEIADHGKRILFLRDGEIEYIETVKNPLKAKGEAPYAMEQLFGEESSC
jgi:putative ABC transport system ATP-binding protein